MRLTEREVTDVSDAVSKTNLSGESEARWDGQDLEQLYICSTFEQAITFML